uniref:Sec-independent protein translocase component TatC n=1 Tax=Hypnea nidifica TaxID=673448 RepID=UPI0030020248|nr:Sec-independent protein translocase component TatC [Hypnea nidifica]
MCCMLCGYIVLQHLSLIIFLESILFTQLGFNQVILLNITDLFDLIWLICLKNALFFSSIYCYYSLVYFFKPSWYQYQDFYILQLFKNLLKMGFIFLFVLYMYILPLILVFLTQWDINFLKDTFYIKFQLSLLHYITWIFYIKFCFIFMSQFSVWFFTQFYFLIELKIFYKKLKKYKNQIFYGTLCFLYMLSPPDLSLQIFILILNMSLIETLYFYICFIIKNTNFYRHAYNTTTLKKIKKK